MEVVRFLLQTLLVMVITGIGPWIKIVFIIVNSTFDVVSDLLTGLHHNQVKNVTRYFGNSTMVPDNCFPNPDFNVTGSFKCREKDLTWAVLTFACIHLPSVMTALFYVFHALSYSCVHSFDCNVRKFLLSSLISFIVPFPFIVFFFHVTSLLVANSQLQLVAATITVYSEGMFEAAPQLILQTYIILSDFDREIDVSQIVSILTSVITISKITIEMFLIETYIPEENVQGHFVPTNDDSMLKDRSVLEKLKLMIQFSPAFLTSLVFKAGSISIISAFLKEYSAVYFVMGDIIIFFFFLFYFDYNNFYERVCVSSSYSITNFVILSKDIAPLGMQTGKRVS